MTLEFPSQEAALRRTLEALWQELSEELSPAGGGTLQSAELALCTASGPLRLALDSYGLPHLLVPVGREVNNIEDRRSSGVHLATRTLVVGDEAITFLDLECRRRSLAGVFTGLVADICMSLAHSNNPAEQAVPKVLEGWRALLGGQQRWTLQRLAGLYGELLVLEHLLSIDSAAADTWTGPGGAAHDFRTHRNAIEVKTTTSPQGRTIHVHGFEQLTRPPSGTLKVVWLKLATSAPGSADDIPAIAQRCLSVGEPYKIISCLERLGIYSLTAPDLQASSFSLVDQRLFEVDDSFPSITPASFPSGLVPTGICGVDYVVDLDTVRHSDYSLHQGVRQFLEA
ncbi:PD-(D/E)XK motif protein [Micromonospora chalcea]|uniref:PD-(D/E)XK motif protein n=1 Tax=Micromonospora chalcea TaxID=1874 RepID=UPI0035CCCCC1